MSLVQHLGMAPHAHRLIPAFLNPLTADANAARAALSDAGRFEIEDVPPDALAARVRAAVVSGATRVVVAGGDGSIGAAAASLLGTRAELAIVPCGTRNHLARDLSIPLALPDAARLAAEGRSIPVDAASVNDRVFLNTSSVGAYVTFVRTRERLERRIGYRPASLIAGARLFVRLPIFRISVQIDGRWREYLTPLVFVGVNERELKLPTIGARVPRGRVGLHVMVIRSRSGARALALALAAAARGVHAVSSTPAMDAFLVDALRVESHMSVVAIDGELVHIRPPLIYRHIPGSLRVVVRAA